MKKVEKEKVEREDEDDGSLDKEKKEDKEGKEEGASNDSPLRLCDPSTIQHYPTP